MDTNKKNMSLFFKALSTRFRAGLAVAPPVDVSAFCEDVPLSTDATDFSWLGEAEDVRLWEGSRELTELASYKYEITCAEYERTIRCKLRDLENDHTGLYALKAEKLGRAFARWKMNRVLNALRQGHATVCLDGQFFFDTDHPVGVEGTGSATTYANVNGTAANAGWYLFDTSHILKPVLFQSEGAVFESLTNANTSDHVFKHREALYGGRVYGGEGYSFPQYAFKDTAPFSAARYKADRALMEGATNIKGQLVGSSPDLLVYGRGQRDTIEDILFSSNVAVTGNDPSGAGGIGLRKPTLFSGLSSLYIPFLP